MESQEFPSEGRFSVDKGLSGVYLERARAIAQKKWLEALRKQGYTCTSKVTMYGPYKSLVFRDSSDLIARGDFDPSKEDYVLSAWFTHKVLGQPVTEEMKLWRPTSAASPSR